MIKLGNLIPLTALFLSVLSSCTGQNKDERTAESMNIRLNSDSSAIELREVPVYIIEKLSSDSLNFLQWSDFFAVYKESQDPEMRDFQSPLSGSYSVEGNRIRFRPDSAFVRGCSYFSRCYTKRLPGTSSDILRSGKLIGDNGYLEFRFNLSDK